MTPIHLIFLGAFVHALTITTGLYLTAYGVWAMITHTGEHHEHRNTARGAVQQAVPGL